MVIVLGIDVNDPVRTLDWNVITRKFRDVVWILQISGDVVVASGARVTLTGGAKAENIFWQVAGSTTVHTTAHRGSL